MPTLRLPDSGLSASGGDLDGTRAAAETSDERFDRAQYARRALDLVVPPNTTVAICEGGTRVVLESGRVWGTRSQRWAMLAVSPRASRRAIALAVAELARVPHAYALDVLMDGARASGDSTLLDVS
jgi:hypothetical protein